MEDRDQPKWRKVARRAGQGTTVLGLVAMDSLVPIHHVEACHAPAGTFFSTVRTATELGETGPHIPESDFLTQVPGVAEPGTASTMYRARPAGPQGGSIPTL